MAIPFNVPIERDENHQYLRIENLLKELLTLLRWTPWNSVTETESAAATTNNDNNNNNNNVNNHSVPASFAAAAQRFGRRPRTGLDHHRRTVHNQNRRPAQSELPDLVTSCLPAAEDYKKSAKPATTLQVEICPECYANGGKFKVVGVTFAQKKPSDDDQQFMENDLRNLFMHDGQPRPIVEVKSKLKQRLLSLLQPSRIDTSLLTAMFVIIGWKMFIKH